MGNRPLSKQLILLGLNEINFETAAFYIANGESLPCFERLIEKGLIETGAESDYEKLEPWIQWPSIHTGKTFDEHQIFRLGDSVNSDHEQYYEKLEKNGFSVGAVSPMNASNNLQDPAYFIPDPWTQTACDRSFLSRCITSSIRQAVNDNSQSRLTVKTILNMSLAFIILVSPRRFIPLLKYALSAIGRPWRKALLLDLVLYEIHKTLVKSKKPNFSTLFLNAGAHIQHHYFFNSPYVETTELRNPKWYIAAEEDPVLEMLKIYDKLLEDLFDSHKAEAIVATGLSQKPFGEVMFYYRLKDHEAFLRDIGIDFLEVTPRMTRDFLINFQSEEQALRAEEKLSQVVVDREVALFSEIDNRGTELFVVLTYSQEITDRTNIFYSGGGARLMDSVVFVAIKNGEHQSKGFAYFSKGVAHLAPSEGKHVSEIYAVVIGFFGLEASCSN